MANRIIWRFIDEPKFVYGTIFDWNGLRLRVINDMGINDLSTVGGQVVLLQGYLCEEVEVLVVSRAEMERVRGTTERPEGISLADMMREHDL